MAQPETPAARIEGLLSTGAFIQALRASDAMIAVSRRSRIGWIGRARANLSLGRVCDADEDIDSALRLDPADPQANLLRGMVDQRLGRIDAAVERLSKLAASTSPYNIEAAVTLAETFYFAHRRDAFRQFVQAGGGWLRDPRAPLFAARVRAREDQPGAITDLLKIAATTTSVVLKRVAGFEAVQLLDKVGRYPEAFDLALQMHRETTPPFDLEGMLGPINEQREIIRRGGKWITPRVDPVQGVALVVGLPRCGTTLLEQMLDSHPMIGGIGEYDGVEILADGIASTGRTLRDISQFPRDAAAELQRGYLRGALRLKRAGAAWSFDKTLRAWRHLPALASVLPGAVCFHVARDPRDMAISTLLSFFHPVADGWTASLESLRRVTEAERSILPEALATFAFSHEQLVYENLVADPASHAGRCLKRLGLEMHNSVLQPEQNPRAVFTLSHEQVRNPIHGASIGRWQNYSSAFDGSWDQLAAAHGARRLNSTN
ncbi:MAG: sulfotransferase family protein [Phycisphaerales bacterium]|nr:sulfotransferase family protein [Phycisphaerales bacterium]